MVNSTFTTNDGDHNPTTVTPSQVTINEDGDFANKIIRQTKVEVIVISDDKLHIILTNCLSRISSLNQWATPLGILVTLTVTMLTTNFKTFILNQYVWEAIFWIFTIVNVIWLLRCIPYRHIVTEFLHCIGQGKDRKSVRDVRHVIEKIKRGDTDLL